MVSLVSKISISLLILFPFQKEFFHTEPNSCDVMEQGVMFVTRPDGRPTGDAFVQFADEESGAKVRRLDYDL